MSVRNPACLLAVSVVLSVLYRGELAFSQDLVINEVSASYHTLEDSFGNYDDWIEIYNGGDRALNLSGLFLTDDLDDPTRYALPSTGLAAGGYYLVWADNEPEQGPDHAPFALADGGEDLFLVELGRNGQIVIRDSLAFDDQRLKASFGRRTDGSGVLVPFGVATPGRPNRAENEWLRPPEFSVPAGAYDAPQRVALTSSIEGVVIRYTTDGSEPTSSSRRYDGPIDVEESGSVRARSFKSDFAPSFVVTQSYLIDEELNLPAAFIAAAPEDFFDDEVGIYVAGTNGVLGNCATEPKNWNRPWEKRCHFTLIEQDGSLGFEIDAGVSIAGGCSRRRAQKALKISVRSRYGFKEVDYRLFPDRDQDEYKDFKLRNSGNDWDRTMLRDAFQQALGDGEVDLEFQSYRPVELYLNGEYWGIHNIRDVINEDYLNGKFPDVDRDKIDIIDDYIDGIPKEGNADAYNELYSFLEANDLSKAPVYAEASALVDVSQFMNYNILQVYVGNQDWPKNNVKLWRERRDGARWRWMVFDLDVAYAKSRSQPLDENSLRKALDDNGPNYPNPPESTLFLRRFMANREFREEFIQRFATQLNLLYEPVRAASICDELVAGIEEEMGAHAARWRPEGGIGSVTFWRSEIDRLRAFGAQRTDFVREHVVAEFGLGGTYQLRLRLDADSGGSVFVNANERKLPFNYRGEYFDGIPLRLRAQPDSGFRFARWEETGETSEVIFFDSSRDATLTPLFEPSNNGAATASAENLLVTEIHYHPGDSEEFEFLELFVDSRGPVDLGGVTLSGAVDFSFPFEAIVPAGSYVLIVENEEQFRARYADPASQFFVPNLLIAGTWSGRLANSGERIQLSTRGGRSIFALTYDDGPGWPAAADGNGSSLELVSLAAPPTSVGRGTFLSDPANWRASGVVHGSPGSAGARGPSPSLRQTSVHLLGAATLLRADESRALLFDAEIEWRAPDENGIWDAIRFVGRGAGDESTLLNRLTLHLDTNGDGLFDAGDQQLGESREVLEDNGAVEFSFGALPVILQEGRPRRFFLVAETASDAPPASGASLFFVVLALSVAGASCVVVALGLWAIRQPVTLRGWTLQPRLAGALGTTLSAVSLSLLPVACGGGGGGGGGGVAPAPQGRTVRFDIERPEDVHVLGADSGSPGDLANVPVEGPSLRL